MKLPDLHINITSTMVGAYAAVVSTATMTIQAANFLRDRMRLKVKVMFNRQIINDPRRNAKKTLIQVNVTNIGRRPITVTGIGVTRLYPCKTHFVLTDIEPGVPRELTEGKYVDAFVPQDDIRLEEIRSWEAYTSIGRTARWNQAPWYKRVVSDIGWRAHFRRERKKKAATA